MQCSLLLNNPTFVLIGFKAANFQKFLILTWFWFCLTPLVLVRLELCLFWPPWQDPFQRCPQLISLFLQNVGVPCHDTVSQELKANQHSLGMGLFVCLYSSESIRWLGIPHKARESSQNYLSLDKGTMPSWLEGGTIDVSHKRGRAEVEGVTLQLCFTWNWKWMWSEQLWNVKVLVSAVRN